MNEGRTPQVPAERRAPRVPDDDVIDLTLSSPESTLAELPVLPSTKPAAPPKKSGKDIASKTTQGLRSPAKEPDGMLPLFLDDSESEHEGGQEPDSDSDQEGVLYDPFNSVDNDSAILVL